MKTVAPIVLIGFVLTSCAKSSKQITPAYVSPEQYRTWNCDQLTAELIRLRTRVTELGGRLDEASDADKAHAGIGLVLFWPTLLLLGGTRQQEAEYARLAGEHEAVQQAMTAKGCVIPPVEKKPDAPESAKTD